MFDPSEFNSDNRKEKLEQVWSFSLFLINDTSKINKLNLSFIEKEKMLDNLIYWNEKYEKYENCKLLKNIKLNL